MTNHTHIVGTGHDRHSIPRMMQALGRSYVQYINITYKRTGARWEGRYRAPIVSSSTHLLTLCQYIELNPARAIMVTRPGQYPWSSYRHNAMAIPIGLITEHEEYKNLGNTHSARILNYRKLFPTNLPGEILEEIRLCTNKGWVIGNDTFRQEIQETLERKVHGSARKSKRFKAQSKQKSANLTL
jgi:putative transposase